MLLSSGSGMLLVYVVMVAPSWLSMSAGEIPKSTALATVYVSAPTEVEIISGMAVCLEDNVFPSPHLFRLRLSRHLFSRIPSSHLSLFRSRDRRPPNGMTTRGWNVQKRDAEGKDGGYLR